MKIELSPDQNTLTLNGIEYEARVESGPYPCERCALYKDGCFIANNWPDDDSKMPFDYDSYGMCNSESRDDLEEIYWVKKEVKNV